MKITGKGLGLCLAVLMTTAPAGWALEVLDLDGSMDKITSFIDDRPGKTTKITYERVNENKGNVLKVRYFLDNESWCGVLKHSLKQNWLGATAVHLTARGTRDSQIRVSFWDANSVSYIYNLTISDAWKTYTIKMSEFQKNPYFQPPQAKPDQPLNLSDAMQVQFEPETQGNGIFYLSNFDVIGVVVLKKDIGVPEKSTAKPRLYEDFSANQLVSLYDYADKEHGAFLKASTLKRANRTKNAFYLKIDYDSGTGDYTGGVGFGSSKYEEGAPFDASGLSTLVCIIKAPKDVQFTVGLKETDDNDGEKWIPDNWLKGTGKWEKYILPLTKFEKSRYSGNQTGNLKLDLSYLRNVEIEVAAKQGKGSIFCDKIYFK